MSAATISTTADRLLSDDIIVIPGDTITRIVVKIVRTGDRYAIDTRHVDIAANRIVGMHVDTLHLAASYSVDRLVR